MDSKKTYKEKVEYFNNLVISNIKKAENRNTDEEKEEAVFYNVSIKLDGSETIFYIAEDDYIYTMYKEGLEKYKEREPYCEALKWMDKLSKYSNKEISLTELLEK